MGTAAHAIPSSVVVTQKATYEFSNPASIPPENADPSLA